MSEAEETAETRMIIRLQCKCEELYKRNADLQSVLSEAYGHLASGSATEFARATILAKIRTALGWSDVEAEAVRKIAAMQNWASQRPVDSHLGALPDRPAPTTQEQWK